MVYSSILNKYYNPSNDSVVYLTNTKQVFLYLNNGAQGDLVDILYAETKKDCLVFVFKKSKKVKELYELWNNRQLQK